MWEEGIARSSQIFSSVTGNSSCLRIVTTSPTFTPCSPGITHFYSKLGDAGLTSNSSGVLKGDAAFLLGMHVRKLVELKDGHERMAQ
jgi:hypothetical protein